MAIKFYYSPRSNATRIKWTLEELGVPYETVQVDIRAGDQKKPEFLKLNPNGKVPTIELDGTPVFESVAIQIALGERYGVAKGLWPAAGTPEQLEAVTWLVWGQVTMAAAMFRHMMNTNDWFPAEARNEKQAESALAELHGCLRILDERLAEREYVTGSHFTLTDLDLASVLGWGLQVCKVDTTTAYPKLTAWQARIAKRPAMGKAMSDA